MKDYERLTERTPQNKIPYVKEVSIEEAIKYLAELEDKIESGKLIELPNVYYINFGGEVVKEKFDTDYRIMKMLSALGYTPSEEGKMWFKSKEAAETKLAKLRSDK